jgi:hypothetical protein
MVRKYMSIVLCIAVVAAFAVPATALARGGAGKKPTAGKSAQAHGKKATSQASAKTPKGQAKKAAGSGSAVEAKGKSAKGQAKKAAKAAGAASLAGALKLKSHSKFASVMTSPSTEPSPSAEATKTKGAWSRDATPTAYFSITKNIMKRLEKGKFVPPGLKRVWYKFTAWLGLADEATPPWEPVMPPPSTPESPTVDGSTPDSPTVDGSTPDSPTVLPPDPVVVTP